MTNAFMYLHNADLSTYERGTMFLRYNFWSVEV